MVVGGYTGNVVFVDLTSGSIREEKLPEGIYRNFIGGVGLGVRVLYERMKAKVDPLSSSNSIGFVTGPLTGTAVPSAPRLTVVTKSPLTGTWGDSNVGGYFAPELKAADYDAIFIRGISPRPVYLYLHDGNAEIRDATHLWGKDTVETEEILRHDLGDPKIRIASIGPAGESVSLLSAIITDGRAAARSGVGAVMGAKRLKAVAVRGKGKVPVADPQRLDTLRSGYLKNLKGDKGRRLREEYSTYGTCHLLSPMIISGAAPIKNWSLIGEESFPNHFKLAGNEVLKYQVGKFACAGCPIGCGGVVTVEKGPYAVNKAKKPEYESIAAIGPLCLNDNLESVIKANDLCNRYGLDTISAGTAVAFAMECYDRGLIDYEATEGIELVWGNAEATIIILEKMIKRQGFGAVLADGVMGAAARIGKGSEKWAIHVHGQEPAFHDPRFYVSRGTGYLYDPTPGRHTTNFHATTAEAGGVNAPYPELQFPILAFGDYQGKGQIYATVSNYHQVFVSAGLCLFARIGGFLPAVDYISAVTGWDFTVKEALVTGRRIQTLRQAFNIREGLKAGDFRLPERIRCAPSVGPFAGRSVDFDAMKESYYEAMGWDVVTGRPTEQTLRELGLKELVGAFV